MVKRRPPLRDLSAPPTRGARPAAPPLGRAASALVADLARKTRFVDPDLAARWAEFAGPELSKICRPGRLSGGPVGRTLEVIVPHGAAATSVEFAAETLRRRLNGFFGPDAIGRIEIAQGPAPASPKPPLFSRFRKPAP
jgi:hypothetical protein